MENAFTLNKAYVQNNPSILKSVAEVFNRLHSFNDDTGVIFDVFKMMEEYETIILNKNGEFWPDYQEIKNKITQLQKEIEGMGVEQVPCHNDPLCENFILGDNKLFLTDWEYGGINDPMWDLADFIIESEINSKLENILLNHYFGRIPKESEIRRVKINKVFVDFLWSLWALMKFALEGSLDMKEWADSRYVRCKEWIVLLDGVQENAD